jgi:phosphoglycerol transferase MdoB-like AlkP superfamily enzyme
LVVNTANGPTYIQKHTAMGLSANVRFIKDLLWDWIDSPYLSVAAGLAIPFSIVLYSSISMGIGFNLVGLLDHVVFMAIFFLVYQWVARRPSFALSLILTFLYTMAWSAFYLFIVLHYRFFHTWGQMDTLKQWEDLSAIWTGVLVLLKPTDLIMLLLLPLFLWLFTARHRWVVPPSWRRKMVLATLLLGIFHVKSLSEVGRYAEQNPFFYVLRHKFIQLQLTYSEVEKKTGDPWKAGQYQLSNASLYEKATDDEYPFQKSPRVSPPTLPRALVGRPNVVLILMESVRAYESGSYGASLSFTPYFDALAKEGVLMENFYANGAQTIRSEFAIHSSYLPNRVGGSVYVNRPSLSILTLPMILKERGYRTLWIGSHPPTFDRKIEFLSRHGIDAFRYQLPPGYRKVGWGASDEDMFRYAFEILSKEPEPFFAEIMTLSNHFPWSDIPENPAAPPVEGEPLYQAYCRGMYYTDNAVGKFLERVRKSPLFKNTLFILTGDHGIWLYPSDPRVANMISKQEIYFRVPCLFWFPAQLKPERIATLGSHIDLMPSILDLLSIQRENAFLGTSLFRSDTGPRYVFMIQDARWNFRTEKEYVYDVGPEMFMSHYPFRTFDYERLLKQETSHMYFTSTADLLRQLNLAKMNSLSGGEAERLHKFAEGAVSLYDQVLLKDRIWKGRTSADEGKEP